MLVDVSEYVMMMMMIVVRKMITNATFHLFFIFVFVSLKVFLGVLKM